MKILKMDYNDYKNRLYGCFIGKVVGGTLGAPYEGPMSTHNLSYYDPEPTEMIANDDLDMQVVWLESIISKGLPINRFDLGKAWSEYTTCGFDEYGIALRNMACGVMAPASGAFNNSFYEGLGSTIRTEIWAVLCPGNPELAVKFATEDACVDHYSDGVHSTRFIAAIESAAFVEHDVRKLIDIGLSFVPQNCKFYNLVKDTVRWMDEFDDVFIVREKIIEKYPTDNFTNVIVNIGFLIAGWLYGKGDFGKCLCATVNCGYDTDCTGATLGSILGIINPESIGEEWTKPLGNQLLLSDNIIGMHEDKTIDEMCEKITALCFEVQKYYETGLVIENAPDLSHISNRFAAPRQKFSEKLWLEDDYNLFSSLVSVNPIWVNVIYPDDIALVPGEAGRFFLKLYNPSNIEMDISFDYSVPNNWEIDINTTNLKLLPNEEKTIEFYVTSEKEYKYITQLNFMFIRMFINGLTYEVKFGMPSAIPWIKTNLDGSGKPEIVYSKTYIHPIDKGAYSFKSSFRLTRAMNVKLMAVGAPLLLRRDGYEVAENIFHGYSPSFHRSGGMVETHLNGGWHTVELEVHNDLGLKTYDEIQFGIGVDHCNWAYTAIWRLP